MNDIAQVSNVSKRTLYDFFENKDELVFQMLVQINTQMVEYYNKLQKQSVSALETILLFRQKMKEDLTEFCSAFYEDIKRYPKANTYLILYKNKSLNSLIALLQQGVKEGDFMREVDFDIIAFLMRDRIEKSAPPEQVKKYSHEEVGDTLFFIFVRGICTDKGRKLLEQYVLKERFRKNNK